MKKLLLFIFCIAGFGLSAQLVYMRTYQSVASPLATDVAWSDFDQSYYVASTDGTVITLLQVDATGFMISRRQYSPPAQTGYSTVNIEVRDDGALFLSGKWESSSGNSIQYYILSLDVLGNVLWAKTYGTSSLVMYDDPQFKLLDDDNLLIIESVYGKLGFIKTDPMGNLISSQTFREDTTIENKTPGFSGDVFSDGSYVFTGKRGNDIAVIHSDANGNILWSSILNSGTAYYHANSVTALSNGSSFVCGYENGTPFAMMIDPSGAMQWYKAFSGGGTYEASAQLNDSTVVAIGMNMMQAMITKFDLNGNQLGTVLIGDAMCNVLYIDRVEVSPSGAIASPLVFNGAVNGLALVIIEQGAPLTCQMTSTSLTASTSSSDPGVVVCPIYHQAQAVTVATVASYGSTLSMGTDDICVLLAQETVSTPSSELTLETNVISEGQPLGFTLTGITGEMEYTITDQLGRTVLKSSGYADGSRTSVGQSDHLAIGMYVLTVVQGDKVYSEKFVVR